MKHKTQTQPQIRPLADTVHSKSKQPKPNIVKTRHCNCAYVRLMAVLIIFPVILQTVISLIMLSIGGQGGEET